MAYLFSEDDIRRICDLGRLVNSNLENFNALTDWTHFNSELLELLRRPRVPNFFNDRWVKSFLLHNKQAKTSRKKRRKMKEQGLSDDSTFPFHVPENIEVSKCSFSSNGKLIGHWNFWGVAHLDSISQNR